MTIAMILVYLGGWGYIYDRKGFWRATVWPFALGIALAKIADRELALP